MIRGVHTMFYSSEPEALRAFLRDKLGFPCHRRRRRLADLRPARGRHGLPPRRRGRGRALRHARHLVLLRRHRADGRRAEGSRRRVHGAGHRPRATAWSPTSGCRAASRSSSTSRATARDLREVHRTLDESRVKRAGDSSRGAMPEPTQWREPLPRNRDEARAGQYGQSPVGPLAPGSTARCRGLPATAGIRAATRSSRCCGSTSRSGAGWASGCRPRPISTPSRRCANDPEHAIDLVFAEYLLREELGESPRSRNTWAASRSMPAS